MAYECTVENGIRYLILDKLSKEQDKNYVNDCPLGHCIWTPIGLFRKENALSINASRFEYVMILAEDHPKYMKIQDEFFNLVFKD